MKTMMSGEDMEMFKITWPVRPGTFLAWNLCHERETLHMNGTTNHTANENTSENNFSNSWMDHPAMKGMGPVKLELIRLAAKQTAGKSGRSLAPVMMALITSANKKGIQFTPQEMSLILDILKEGRSREEQNQIDQMVQMLYTHENNT